MESEIELNKLLNNAMSNQAHWYSCGKILFLPWDNYVQFFSLDLPSGTVLLTPYV